MPRIKGQIIDGNLHRAVILRCAQIAKGFERLQECFGVGIVQRRKKQIERNAVAPGNLAFGQHLVHRIIGRRLLAGEIPFCHGWPLWWLLSPGVIKGLRGQEQAIFQKSRAFYLFSNSQCFARRVDAGKIGEGVVMAYDTIHAFSQADVGFEGCAFSQEGCTFTYSGDVGANTIVIEDDDGVLDDQKAAWGQTTDHHEALVSFNGDTEFAGADWSSFASYTVKGSDGSEFKAYVIGRQDEDFALPSAIDGGDYMDQMYVAFSAPLQDGVTYSYSDYSYIGQVDYDDLAEQTIVCFAAGTLIETDRGEVAVETLQAGDLVRTLDHGLQAIRWVGGQVARANGRFAPVEFATGSIGNTRPLRVSPAHRVLVGGWQAQALFGQSEFLVPAAALVNDHSILRRPAPLLTYYHILFDRHEIIFSDGASTESFHPAAAGLDALDLAAKAEIEAIFPHLHAYGAPARHSLDPHEAGVLCLN